MGHRYRLPCPKSILSEVAVGALIKSRAVPPITKRIAALPLTLLLLAGLTLAHPNELLAKTVRYRTAPHPGLVLIKGTSTLHNWTIKSRGLGGVAVFQTVKKDKHVAFILKHIHLTIAVISLKGSDGSGMDATIDRKLISGQNPKIIFVLKKAVLIHHSGMHLPWSTWNATGTLTAAGRSKLVHLNLKVLVASNGTVSIETRTVLKMTDFGISPPTAMLGAIRSGNKIKIKVLWNLTPRRTATPADAANTPGGQPGK